MIEARISYLQKKQEWAAKLFHDSTNGRILDEGLLNCETPIDDIEFDITESDCDTDDDD